MQAPVDPRIQRMVMKQELKLYNDLLNACFKDCVRSLNNTKLYKEECVCLENCFKKSMSSYMKIGEAFAYASMVKGQASQANT